MVVMINPEHTPLRQNETPSEQEQIQRIIMCVRKYRQKEGRTEPEHATVLFESSCIGYPGGEIAHLVERQLSNTREGYGSWQSLVGDGAHDVRQGVLDYFSKYHPEFFE